MRSTLKLGLMIMLAFSLLACASSFMVKATSPLKIDPAHAKIVFIRNSFLLSPMDAVLFHVVDNSAELLGYSNNGTQIEALIAPGYHVFMVTTNGGYGSSEFMRANVEAGKTYYVIVTPNTGVYHFFLHPVERRSDAKFQWDSNQVDNLIKDTSPVVLKEKTIKLENNKEWKMSIIGERYIKWQTKPQFEIDSVTIRPEDGR